MKLYPLKTLSGEDIVAKYVQWVEGVCMVKATDGEAYHLGGFTCNSNFVTLCNAFNLWDCRRNRSV
jgi:hypothetical protein